MSEETRDVSINIHFVKRDDRWHASSGAVTINGIPTGDALDALLNTMEEVILRELVEYPRVQELVDWRYEFPGVDELVPLEDRTKQLVVKLLAHQLLLGRVASRGYGASTRSIAMRTPHQD